MGLVTRHTHVTLDISGPLLCTLGLTLLHMSGRLHILHCCTSMSGVIWSLLSWHDKLSEKLPISAMNTTSTLTYSSMHGSAVNIQQMPSLHIELTISQ